MMEHAYFCVCLCSPAPLLPFSPQLTVTAYIITTTTPNAKTTPNTTTKKTHKGYPFNTFGEVAACWVQDVVLIALILRFSAAPRRAFAGVFGSLLAFFAWLLAAAPPGALAALQASTILAMALGSRLPQIVLNWRRGDAGVLSVASCGLNVAGNAARVFTTLVLTRDPLLLGGILTQGAKERGRGRAREVLLMRLGGLAAVGD